MSRNNSEKHRRQNGTIAARAAALGIALALGLVACRADAADDAATPAPPPAVAAATAASAAASAAPVDLEEFWGIEVESIRISAAGKLVDFRYRVIDPEKAKHLLNRKNQPYLRDEASGLVLRVPEAVQVGQLRSNTTRPKAGKVYFVLFSNPGQLVKPGGKVTVIIGDFQAPNLTVQG